MKVIGQTKLKIHPKIDWPLLERDLKEFFSDIQSCYAKSDLPYEHKGVIFEMLTDIKDAIKNPQIKQLGEAAAPSKRKQLYATMREKAKEGDTKNAT